MIIDKILKAVTEESQNRPQTSPLRMSSAGKCARQIGYQYHGYEAEPLPSRTLMVFRLGDTIEAEIKALIQKYVISDDLSITYPKDALEIKVGSQVISGHVDGIIEVHRPLFVQEETRDILSLPPVKMILEIKSINTLGFKRVVSSGLPDGYEEQATAYMKSSGIKKTLFIFYNKDTSHLHEIIFDYNPEIWTQIEKRFLSVINSTKDNLPNREYEANDKGLLPWQCSYCSFNKLCWPDAVTSFDNKNKPQMKVSKQ